MRAVYKCEDNPYLSLSADEFNPLYEYFEGIDDIPVKRGIYRLPSEAYSIQFSNGLAVVTEPTDIVALRRYISRRADNLITEVSFEGNEAELYPEPTTTPQPEPEPEEKVEPKGYKDTYEELSEWDKKMVSSMR